MKNNLKKRVLSWALAIAMMVSTVPSAALTAFAEEIEPQTETIAVESVTLNEETLSLEVGGTSTLEAAVLPEEATDKTVTWESSDPTIATVTDGTVTAVAVGEAVITATAGEANDSCTVTVAQAQTITETQETVEVTGVALDSTSLELTVGGETKTLTATVTPENATDKTVTWESSDPTVATVTDGVVTAVAAGTATITAKAGDITAECAVTVAVAEENPIMPVEEVAVESVALDKSTAEVEVGGTVELTATVTPETASCGAHTPQPEKASGPQQKPSTAKKEKGSPGDSDVQSRLKTYPSDFINHRPGSPEFIISISLYLLSGSSYCSDSIIPIFLCEYKMNYFKNDSV